MTNEIVTTQNNFMPALSITEAKARYNALVEYTKSLMTAGKDYGVIPGTGNKPTLLKPGAEKLCTLFGLVPDYEIVDRIVDFEKGLFYYHYKCLLSRNGQLVAAAEGSANSMEKKYRWRNVVEWNATEEDKATAVKVQEKRDKNGKLYKLYTVPNSEPFDLVNTLQKMAQKRALVAATLLAANASEFYTQDIEDMDLIEGEFVETGPGPQPSNGNNQPTITAKMIMVKIGKNSYPKDWGQEFAQRKMYEHSSPFEIDGILQKLNLSAETLTDVAVGAVGVYLDAKSTGSGDPLTTAQEYINACINGQSEAG